jgi:hypothetical protein
VAEQRYQSVPRRLGTYRSTPHEPEARGFGLVLADGIELDLADDLAHQAWRRPERTIGLFPAVASQGAT